MTVHINTEHHIQLSFV